MGRDRNGARDEKPVSSGKDEDGDEGRPSKKRVSDKLQKSSDSGYDDQKKYNESRGKRRDSSGSDSEDERKRNRSYRRKRKSRGRYRSDEDSESSSDSKDADDESESRSGSDEESESESEEERRRRKKKERKSREKEDERERRRRKREKEKKRRKKEEKRKKEKKKKEKGKKGAVTDSWGKYGVIRETDMWNKRPEFTAWLAEVKQVNLESLANWEEKQMFKDFMEDHNTATFPSKKYYNLDAYHKRKMEKEMKKGAKKVMKERTIFNDEEQRRLELLQEREKQKEEQVKALKISMQSGMAQAMKEQAQLREEMAYLYKIGNSEAAAAIQRRLDPDLPM